jgi:hypothetical protein
VGLYKLNSVYPYCSLKGSTNPRAYQAKNQFQAFLLSNSNVYTATRRRRRRRRRGGGMTEAAVKMAAGDGGGSCRDCRAYPF